MPLAEFEGRAPWPKEMAGLSSKQCVSLAGTSNGQNLPVFGATLVLTVAELVLRNPEPRAASDSFGASSSVGCSLLARVQARRRESGVEALGDAELANTGSPVTFRLPVRLKEPLGMQDLDDAELAESIGDSQIPFEPMRSHLSLLGGGEAVFICVVCRCVDCQ